MAGQVDGHTFDVRDARLLEELFRARILSTSQLAQLGGKPEPLGTLASRLAKLAQGGWLRPVPRVRGPNGAVTGWHRADQPLPEHAKESRAAEAIRLNAVYAALRTGPNPVDWRVRLESPVTAVLRFGDRRLHLCFADDVELAHAACLRFGSFLRDPERGDSRSSDDEVLLLCEDLEQRDAIRREVELVRAKLPGGPAAVHVSVTSDAIRVLHRKLHGAPPAPPAPASALSRQDAERITEFLSEVL